jgi:hypothetical protein
LLVYELMISLEPKQVLRVYEDLTMVCKDLLKDRLIELMTLKVHKADH